MGARELLADLAGAGFTIEAADDKLVIRPASKLTDDLRAVLRAAKPELLKILTRRPVAAESRPYGLSKADADAAHAEPWDEAACARFVARVGLFLRCGLAGADADDLAERLHLRDVQADDRRLCIECGNLSGHRCANYGAAGIRQQLPAMLIFTLKRCSGFVKGTKG